MKTWIASLATMAATVASLPGAARADHFTDIDQLACLLSEQAAEACHEIRYHFVGAPNYRHLYADTFELYRQADRIHELVHRRASLPEVCAAVDELDELYHHVEEIVEETARGIGSPRIGHHHGRFGHSRFSSYHLRRFHRKLAEMGETIHALGDKVDAAREPVRGGIVTPPLPPESLPDTPPTYGPVRPTGPAFPSAERRAIRFGNKDGLSFTLYLGR